VEAAVSGELDIHSTRRVVESVDNRTLVANTDTGVELKHKIADLESLLEAYRTGVLPERKSRVNYGTL